MPPLLPPLVNAETLLRRRSARPLWTDPATTTSIPYGEDLTYTEVADRIIRDVGARGDSAVRQIANATGERLPSRIEVSVAQIREAAASCPPEVLRAIEASAARIRAFCERDSVGAWRYEDDGLSLGQLTRPVSRVGIYVPGGEAPLVSSLLMAAIPARVAGVDEVVACTPPAQDGDLVPVLAAGIVAAGVDRSFTVGGPAAIAALALGTETVPKADLICGPGGGPTVATMARVTGLTGVVSLPGPTETLLIADETAAPAVVAADLLAQAEHARDAWPVLLTTSETLATLVQQHVAAQLSELERAHIARASLSNQGSITLVAEVPDAIAIANQFAAEHLCLLVDRPWSYVDQITNAGGIFVGEHACEALGDYIAGPSHIMPTGGSARWSSPLSVRDFVRMTTVVGATADAARRLSPSAITLAEAEGLTAHAASLRYRLSRDRG